MISPRHRLSLKDSEIPQPSKNETGISEIFCSRLRLLRHAHRFCNLFEKHELDPVRFVETVNEIDAGIVQWRDNIPAPYRPGDIILAPKEEYQLCLLTHMEYYALLTIIFSALDAVARLFPLLVDLRSHRSVRIRSSAALRVSNARHFLQTLDVLADSSQMQPSIDCWYVLSSSFSDLWLLTRTLLIGSTLIRYYLFSPYCTHISSTNPICRLQGPISSCYVPHIVSSRNTWTSLPKLPLL